MAKNKTWRNASIAIGIFLFIAILVALAGNFVQQAQDFPECFNPDWNTLKCETTKPRITPYTVTRNANMVDIKCGIDELLAAGTTCNVDLTKTEISPYTDLAIQYRICNVENGVLDCPDSPTKSLHDINDEALKPDNTNEYFIGTIPAGKAMRIDACESDVIGFPNRDCSFRKVATPYVLKTLDPERVLNDQNCDLTGKEDSNLPRKIGDVVQDDVVTTLQRGYLSIEQALPFVESWNRGDCSNIVSHPQYGDVFCTGGGLYRVQKMEMVDGRIVKLGLQGTVTNQNKVFRGLGERLNVQVQCCPNIPGCDPLTFQMTEKIEDKECVSDAQCFGGDVLPSSNKCGYRYGCGANNKCQKLKQECFECLDNSACSAGMICDSVTNKCIQQKGGKYCGDGICDSTESERSCSKDCGTVVTPPTDWGVIVLFASIALIGGVLAGTLIKRATRNKGRSR